MSVQTIPGLPEGYKPGLEGIIAGVSELSEVNPDQDALAYRGYQAHELAEKATYTEVAYLLLYGKLPTRKELSVFEERLSAERTLSKSVSEFFKQLPKNSNPMVALRLAISLLYMDDPNRDKNDEASNVDKAIHLIAKSPTLIAMHYRLSQNLPILPPNPKLSHAANFLHMVIGKEPDPQTARAFNSTMILYAEHGYNASTFAALVTASTLSDMYSAVASAIGTLKGPLHGGANEKSIEMLLKIGDVKNVIPWLKDTLARKEKVMGFGHRIYKKQDSRAPLVKKLAEEAAKRVGDEKIFRMSCLLEEEMMKEKKLFPNVDFHGAVFYYLSGLPVDIYTPIFAMSRMAGWAAHVIEQHKTNRLIRPQCLYTGAKGLQYIPIEDRQ